MTSSKLQQAPGKITEPMTRRETPKVRSIYLPELHTHITRNGVATTLSWLWTVHHGFTFEP